MRLDVLIQNGRVVDPAQNVDGIIDIGIVYNKVVNIQGQEIEPAQVIDATGCYVFPGLIDFHTHIFYGGSNMGVCPNHLLATGVTTAVDSGSTGSCTFPIFKTSIIENSDVRIKSYLSCYPMGLGGGKIVENFDPKLFDKRRLKNLMQCYPKDILGLKIRISRDLMENLTPLSAAIEMSEELGGILPVCVHVTDPAGDMDEVMNMMRPGDIICHMYHGTGATILDESGKVRNSVLKARECGVVFDVANGKKNFSIDVCKAALEQGFLPDIISTDMTNDKINYASRVRTLPFVLSKFISLGLDLKEVIRCATETPAELMGMEGQIGTLKPGSYADVSIFKLAERRVVHHDTHQTPYIGDCLLIPQMTIIDGKLAFGQIDFNLPEEDVQG
jgi:dihydroorotase